MTSPRVVGYSLRYHISDTGTQYTTFEGGNSGSVVHLTASLTFSLRYGLCTCFSALTRDRTWLGGQNFQIIRGLDIAADTIPLPFFHRDRADRLDRNLRLIELFSRSKKMRVISHIEHCRRCTSPATRASLRPESGPPTPDAARRCVA